MKKFVCKHLRSVVVLIGVIFMYGLLYIHTTTDVEGHMRQALYKQAALARFFAPRSDNSLDLETASEDMALIKRIIDSNSFIKTAYAIERGLKSDDRSSSVDVNIITIHDVVLVDESDDIKVGASTGWPTVETMAMSNNAFAFLPTYITEGKGTYRNINLPEGEESFIVGDGAYRLYGKHRWQSPVAQIIAKKLLDEGYLDRCQAAVVYLPSQFGLHFPHPNEEGRPYATHIDGKLVVFVSAMSKIDMIGRHLYHANIIEQPAWVSDNNKPEPINPAILELMSRGGK